WRAPPPAPRPSPRGRPGPPRRTPERITHLPPAAPAVNGSGLGSSADGEREEGIDRSFERAATSLRLGEEKPAFECGEQGGGEVVRVDVRPEFPVGMQGSQSIADGRCPLIEPCHDERSSLG